MELINITEDHIVHLNLQGYIELAQAQEIIQKIQDHMSEYQDRKISLCIYLGTDGDTSREARKLYVDFLKETNLHKIAMWGGNSFTENIAKFILMAAGVNQKVSFFPTEDAAHQWLQI